MKGTKRATKNRTIPSKKKMASSAISSAMALANANAGKLKSVKVKIKFDGGSKSPKKRPGRSKARGGY